MARQSAREIGRIESRYASELGELSWTWVLKADGRVLYRLSHVNGRPERNYWRLLRQLDETERAEIGTDNGRAIDLLAYLARERGHHLAGNHR
jgi:hypothetical protein